MINKVHHFAKDEKEKRPIFKATVETQTIYKRLASANVGDVITYAELSDLVQKDIQLEGRYHLDSARRMLLNERMVFESVANVGVKYCNDEESLHAGSCTISRSKNLVRKGKKKILCADFDKLDNASKIKFNTNLSILGAIECFMKQKSLAKIEQKVMMTGNHINYDETINLFSKLKV